MFYIDSNIVVLSKRTKTSGKTYFINEMLVTIIIYIQKLITFILILKN